MIIFFEIVGMLAVSVAALGLLWLVMPGHVKKAVRILDIFVEEDDEGENEYESCT